MNIIQKQIATRVLLTFMLVIGFVVLSSAVSTQAAAPTAAHAQATVIVPTVAVIPNTGGSQAPAAPWYNCSGSTGQLDDSY
jgi:hypothetical protein